MILKNWLHTHHITSHHMYCIYLSHYHLRIIITFSWENNMREREKERKRDRERRRRNRKEPSIIWIIINNNTNTHTPCYYQHRTIDTSTGYNSSRVFLYFHLLSIYLRKRKRVDSIQLQSNNNQSINQWINLVWLFDLLSCTFCLLQLVFLCRSLYVQVRWD